MAGQIASVICLSPPGIAGVGGQFAKDIIESLLVRNKWRYAKTPNIAQVITYVGVAH
jgi:hypothetical protein